MEVVSRDANHDRNPVVGADLCERPCSIAGRLYDKNSLFVGLKPGQNGKGFRFLEGAGPEPSPYLGIPSGECNVQIVQTEMLYESLRFVRYRCAGILQGSFDRHPVRISVYAVQSGPR